MFTSKTSRRAAIAAAIITPAAFLAAATPAFATSTPEPVSATVDSSLTISGLTPITFPHGIPGAVVTYQEQYAVQANVTFTVSVQDSGSPAGQLTGPSGASITDDHINVANQQQGNGGRPAFNLTTLPQPTFSNGSNNAISDLWSLTIPTAQPPGAYTGQVTYSIVSS